MTVYDVEGEEQKLTVKVFAKEPGPHPLLGTGEVSIVPRKAEQWENNEFDGAFRQITVDRGAGASADTALPQTGFLSAKTESVRCVPLLSIWQGRKLTFIYNQTVAKW